MDPEYGFPAARLTDDLVVEILSKLPFKSFCRFKCVCKAWLAFSSDPHYCQKLPKIPTGLLYQSRENYAIQLVSLPQNCDEIDGALSFLPHHEHLELMDCCNGLVLCKYRSSYTSPDICRFIVCNPATREWRTLPDTHPEPDDFVLPILADSRSPILAFNPSWLPHFYVFNFQRFYWAVGKLEVFSSDLSTWLVYDAWSPEIRRIYGKPHMFIDGALYVRQMRVHEILMLKDLEAMKSDIPPNHQTIELPHDPSIELSDGRSVANYTKGYFGQSSGALHYALPEADGHAIRVWNLDVSEPYDWSVKYRLNMSDAFGRDDLVHNEGHDWQCAYVIVALDFEREVIFLFDRRANKLRSYNISSGKLNEIQQDDHHCHWSEYKFCHYVACYSKLPA